MSGKVGAQNQRSEVRWQTSQDRGKAGVIDPNRLPSPSPCRGSL